MPGSARIEPSTSLSPARSGSAAKPWAEHLPSQAVEQLPESCPRGIWGFTAAQHSQWAAKEKREPSPHILVPAQPANSAAALPLPALKCFSAAAAGGWPCHQWGHKSRTLLCFFLQGIPLPRSPDSLCPMDEGGIGDPGS